MLTTPAAREAIAAVAARHFPKALVLTDDAVAGEKLPADHQARNTWLRKRLYAQDAIEANFLAADEDSLALRPLTRAYYQTDDVHTAYSFQRGYRDLACRLANDDELRPRHAQCLEASRRGGLSCQRLCQPHAADRQ